MARIGKRQKRRPAVFVSSVPAVEFVDLYFHCVLSAPLSPVDKSARRYAETRASHRSIGEPLFEVVYQFIVHEIFNIDHQILGLRTSWRMRRSGSLIEKDRIMSITGRSLHFRKRAFRSCPKLEMNSATSASRSSLPGTLDHRSSPLGSCRRDSLQFRRLFLTRTAEIFFIRFFDGRKRCGCGGRRIVG